ncbi:sensor domain-containing protein [Streptomyces sp. 549]|uniref:sensor histidine kinase n=1 Tax=Streptomyces sp. 549 TaxID=3049076 RepID=UPI0024C335EF|nr:sensor histidine kinase [Streptomyces sp. 549]MDK1472972.1 sensor domain-containing protein [Streptomyces sp. 549]
MNLLRAPLSGRTWREFGYLLTGLPVAVTAFSVLITLFSASAGLLVTFVGVPLLAFTLLTARALGQLERARARALLGLDVAEPEPVGLSAGGSGPMARIGAVLKNGASWRHLLYGIVYFPWALFSFVSGLVLWTCGWSMLTYPLWFWVFPTWTDQPGLQLYGDGEGNGVWLDSPPEIALTSLAGLLLVLGTPWWFRALTAVDRLMVSGLLGPSRLAARMWELESDRVTVTDTASADLRRIERDLHDGAQARLVALAMDLGLAKEKLTEDPEAAARMVDEAHGEVKAALTELRDLARGIHPAILTDRGLDAALSSLAARCTIPVTVTVDTTTRPAPAIESITYFTASELLQNISKHANAHHATLDLWRTDNRLLLQVTDNGQGGATAHHGTGLAGLAERLDSVDGHLLIHSPPGGPTTITAGLPWRDRTKTPTNPLPEETP